MHDRRMLSRTIAVLALGAAMLAPAPAGAARSTISGRVTTSDGVELQTTLTGEAPIVARATIVEFSPYGRDSGSLDPGPGFNRLLVQIRGTGDSDGRFDALGPRTQQDVAETLRWACRQPWSTGRLGIAGFSASAITIYNSLHLKLPCVRAAVLKSGTHELYRDLLYPGGLNNLIPGAGVLALIGTPALLQGPDRLGRAPSTVPGVTQGLMEAGLSDLEHPTLDGWWRERGMRGDVEPPSDAHHRRLLRRRVPGRLRGLPVVASAWRAPAGDRRTRRGACRHRWRARGGTGVAGALPQGHAQRRRSGGRRSSSSSPTVIERISSQGTSSG